MVKKSETVRGLHIEIEKHLIEALTDSDFGPTNAGKIRTCVQMHLEMPIIVFSATNTRNDVVFYGVTNRAYYFNSDFRFTIRSGDSPFSAEVKKVGMGEFLFVPMASFKTLANAMTYKEFLVNRELNQGKESYNLKFDMHPFTRYLVIPFKDKVLDNFLKLCLSKDLTANWVIDKLIKMFIRKNKQK